MEVQGESIPRGSWGQGWARGSMYTQAVEVKTDRGRVERESLASMEVFLARRGEQMQHLLRLPLGKKRKRCSPWFPQPCCQFFD
eukprot:366419-Chlamydomonas_euryale.AAC.5